MEVCPHDPNHIVPCRSMENHKATCLLGQLGYSKEEQVWKDSLEMALNVLRVLKMICVHDHNLVLLVCF